jgi:hypothetical protein
VEGHEIQICRYSKLKATELEKVMGTIEEELGNFWQNLNGEN